MNTPRSIAVVGVTVAALGLGVSGATAETPKRDAPRTVDVTGTARVFVGAYPDDDVRITFDAHATYKTWGPDATPASTRGKVRMTHHFTAQNATLWYEAKVDCAVAGGSVATVTAVITAAATPIKDWVGKRMAFTVLDNGRRDQVGNSSPHDDVPTCLGGTRKGAPAPFNLITHGDFKVRHNLPPIQ
ncbi:hypothetical protein [Spirillospora sp. CA-294931]|uniref:hypothetical protein n=1 Tax=Spirillospora sp. CA-294931 TaxID=3240042 RepID=UPI003D8A444E